MKLRFYRIPIFLMLIMSVVFVSCDKEEWDNHYYASATDKSDLNMYQYIKSQDNLSIFSQMLQITHYDSILSKSQVYTVWAPDNEALKDVVLTDTVEVKKLVENHITRFLHTTSGVTEVQLLMMNKKLLRFAK